MFLVMIKPNCCQCFHHIFIDSLSMPQSIHIQAFCIAHSILQHLRFVAQPEAREEAGGLCRCHTLTENQSTRITTASERGFFFSFAAHLFTLLHCLSRMYGVTKITHTQALGSVSSKCLRRDVCCYKSGVTAAASSAFCRAAGRWGWARLGAD